MNARTFNLQAKRLYSIYSTKIIPQTCNLINEKQYLCDDYTNVTPKILSLVGKNLHNAKYHPLCLLKNRITKHFYKKYIGRNGTPLFSVYDNIDPVVSTSQNFDSLLIPEDHVSRRKSDCYYLNRTHLLRAHTTAHQAELVRMGLDCFLVFGDVYRRDEIDSTHYPVFHQGDALRLFSAHQLSDFAGSDVKIFEKNHNEDFGDRQGFHTTDASKIVEHQLKSTLISLVQHLFGNEVETRWVDVYFPFTHPSWELELLTESGWVELLGCGITRHEILAAAGASDRIGWAFGLGLERLAMRLFSIPDIRLFWSTDSGFISQFITDDPDAPITYKPVSVYPQCINDISFWLPDGNQFEPNDFFEIVRDTAGDIVEQIVLKDEFVHPKTKRKSQCYSIIYRHLERTLTKDEVNHVHTAISDKITSQLGVSVR